MSEGARVIAAKIRNRADIVAASKRTGSALAPRNFSLFMKDLTDSPREVKLFPFDPMKVPEFPDLLHHAIL